MLFGQDIGAISGVIVMPPFTKLVTLWHLKVGTDHLREYHIDGLSSKASAALLAK
jgi:hypothetical protein